VRSQPHACNAGCPKHQGMGGLCICVVFVLCPVQTINQLTKPNEFEKEKRKNKIKIKAVHVELFTYQKATSQSFFFSFFTIKMKAVHVELFTNSLSTIFLVHFITKFW
jgi:hypothetical protein